MILSSEDAGVWVLPVVFLLGVAAVAPVVCVVLAGRVLLRVARSAASGDAWAAFTPGTWLLAAGSAALGAGLPFSVSLLGRPTPWVHTVSFICGCFALAAVAMSGLTAALNRRL
ncbi:MULTISPECIES: hypothetical protein [unclassified Streptomyces]|uniref:hypothetical protein n=1 Tax=unclassified Streptomyces TaxID=2593676 RepID=UPI00074A243E|nr:MULTISPECIES: hypothetical protein [unclassified Streptomyces]KUL64328.1 hypothetical protein ADL30_00420 [Streptomyces sp. NRRL S-1521]THC54988.1 hypothetical protein E7X58_01260 [Streptomyces sp. A1499]